MLLYNSVLNSFNVTLHELRICYHVRRITDTPVPCVRHQESTKPPFTLIWEHEHSNCFLPRLNTVPLFYCLLCSLWLAKSIYFFFFTHLTATSSHELNEHSFKSRRQTIVSYNIEHNAQYPNQIQIFQCYVALKTTKLTVTFLQNMAVFKIHSRMPGSDRII